MTAGSLTQLAEGARCLLTGAVGWVRETASGCLKSTVSTTSLTLETGLIWSKDFQGLLKDPMNPAVLTGPLCLSV